MSAGRPLKYKTVSELENAIADYFEEATPPTLSGLALELGFESRQSMYDYEERPEFSYTIKKARLKIENYHEKRLIENNCTGSIFALKNMSWTDRQEVDHTTKGEKITSEKTVVEFHDYSGRNKDSEKE